MLLAGIFTGCEAILPLFQDTIPRGVFAGISMLAIVGGMVARLTLQKNLHDDE